MTHNNPYCPFLIHYKSVQPTVKPSMDGYTTTICTPTSDIYECEPEVREFGKEKPSWMKPIDAPEEEEEPGVGIEITITLTIGLLLFIINGAAFLNLAWKKRNAQKQFRRNLEVSHYP